MLVDEYPKQTPWALCRSDCPANWFQVVTHEPAITGAWLSLRQVITLLLAIAVTGALVRRTLRASRLQRQTLAPVVVAALILLVSMCGFIVVRLVAPGSPAVDTVGWLYGLAIPTIALGFLVELVRWQLFVATALRRLSAELGAHGDTAALATTLRTTLHDPSLKLLVWDAGTPHWVDSAGAPLDVAGAREEGRAVTEACSSCRSPTRC